MGGWMGRRTAGRQSRLVQRGQLHAWVSGWLGGWESGLSICTQNFDVGALPQDWEEEYERVLAGWCSVQEGLPSSVERHEGLGLAVLRLSQPLHYYSGAPGGGRVCEWAGLRMGGGSYPCCWIAAQVEVCADRAMSGASCCADVGQLVVALLCGWHTSVERESLPCCLLVPAAWSWAIGCDTVLTVLPWQRYELESR